MATINITVAHGNIERETEKAYMLNVGSGPVWLPKSQVRLVLPTDVTESGHIEIPAWLAYRTFGRDGIWRMARNGGAWQTE